jgi:hypothetical protein
VAASFSGLFAAGPIWGWTALIVFGLFWATALLSLTDQASRAFLAGSLRRSGYMQIYTTLTRRAVLRLWARLCHRVEAHTGLAGLARASLSLRLAKAALMIAGLYMLLLSGAGWLVTGRPAAVAPDIPAVFGAIVFGAVWGVNGLFDLLSFAATLTLMRRGLMGRWPILWGLLDLVMAFALLLGLGAALVVAITVLNGVADATLIDLRRLLEGVRSDPWGAVWIYLMLGTTLVPTLLHAGLSLLGLQGVWPRPWRQPVAGWIDAATAGPVSVLRASLALALVWTLPLLGIGGMLWAIWAMAGGALAALLTGYIEALIWLAAIPVGAI